VLNALAEIDARIIIAMRILISTARNDGGQFTCNDAD